MSDVLKLVAKLALDDKNYRDGLKAAPGEARKAGDGIEREARRGLDQLQQRLTAIGQNIGNVGRTLSVNLTAPLMAVATAAIASGRALGNYADNLLDTSARTGLTTDRLQEFANVARAAGVNASALGDAAEMLTRRMTSGEEDTAKLTRALEFLGVELRVSKDDAQAAADRVDVLAQAAIDAGADAGVLEDAIRAAGGVTVDFGRIALDAGADADALRDRLESLGVETRDAGAAFDVLGDVTLSSAGDLRSLDDVMPEILTSLADMEDKTLRNVLANEIFGRAASELIPVLELGSDEIERLAREAQAMGQVLSLDTLNAANEFRIAQAQLTAELSITSREITVALLPILLELTQFVRATVVPAVRAGIDTIVGWIDAFKGLSREQQTVIVAVAAFAAGIGPAMLAVSNAIAVVTRIVTALRTLQTAFVAVRTAALLASGPAGWAVLAGTAIAGLVTWFVRKKRAADDGAEALDGVSDAARLNADAITQARDATDRLAARAERLVGPVNDVRRAVVDSTGSVTELRAKVDEIASTMDGEAKDAFLAFAEQAIATGDDLKTVGERIADRAARDSLISRVNLLAQDIDENGRQAFRNYALEAIATADTQEEAMSRVMEAWAAAQRQAEEAALLMAREAILAQQAVTMLNLSLAYEELRIASSIGNAEREEMLALEQELGREAAMQTFRWQTLNAVVEASNGYYAEGSRQIAALTQDLDILNAGLRENEEAQKNLSTRFGQLTRTTQTLTESGAKPLAAATDDATSAQERLTEKIEYGLDTIRGLRDRIRELNAEIETTADPDRRIQLTMEVAELNAQIEQIFAEIQAGINELEGVRPVTITPTVVVDDETLAAARQARADAEAAFALQRERWHEQVMLQYEREERAEATARMAAMNAVNAEIEARRIAAEEAERVRLMRERNNEQYLLFLERQEQAERAAAIAGMNAVNERIASERAAEAERTRLANQRALWLEAEELRERAAAIAGMNAVNERIAGEKALAAAFAEADRANLGYQDAVTGSAESAVAFAATQVELASALQSVGEATEERVVIALLGLEAAIEQQRATLSPYSQEFADLTERLATVRDRLQAYSDAAKAAATAQEGANLRDATSTREAAAAALELTQRKERLAMATVPDVIESINQYEQALRAETLLVGENTAEYVALAEELKRIAELKALLEDGPKRPVQTGAEALRAGVESFGVSLGLSAEAAQSFAGTILNAVPWLSAAANGWQDLLWSLLSSTEGFDGLMQAINGILDPIIGVLEQLFPPLIELVNALKPVIEVVAALVSVALQPFLFVLKSILIPAITFVANIIKAVWNGIANAINAVLRVIGIRYRVPTIGDAPAEPPAGDAPGDSGQDGVIGSSNGVEVRIDAGGNPSISYTSKAPPAGTIARQRAVVAALQQAVENAPGEIQRSTLRARLAKERQTLDAMVKEGQEEEATSPTPPRDPVPPREPTPPGEPTAPTEPTEPVPERELGLLEQLQRERSEWVRRLEEARTEDEIRLATSNIRRLDAEISRLRNLGAPSGGTELGGESTDGRRPRDTIFVPAPTPPAPDAPAPTPVPERPVVFPEDGLNFAQVSQSVQFAVATPLVEASLRMLEAARLFSGVGAGQTGLFDAVPPFTAVLERLTPVLDRLIAEGVDVNVGTTGSVTRRSSITNALRPL